MSVLPPRTILSRRFATTANLAHSSPAIFSSAAGPSSTTSASFPPAVADRISGDPKYSLRIGQRTTRSICLIWSPAPDVTSTEQVPLFMLTNPHCPHYKFKMQTINCLGATTDTNLEFMYKGHRNEIEVNNLQEDTRYSFRMKKYTDAEWGPSVRSATLSVSFANIMRSQEFHEAVRDYSEEAVLRYIDLTEERVIKRILVTPDREGMTPLMIACQNDDLNMVKTLVKAGANIDFPSQPAELTALMMACFGDFLEIVEYLDHVQVDWYLRDGSGCNALHHAVSGKALSVLEYAFETNYPLRYIINDKDCFDETPLMKAVKLSDHRTSLGVVRFLLEKGADVNIPTIAESVLTAAVIQGNTNVVKLLLKYGADPDYRNLKGENALDIAEKDFEEKLKIINLIVEKIKASGGHAWYTWKAIQWVFPCLKKWVINARRREIFYEREKQRNLSLL